MQLDFDQPSNNPSGTIVINAKDVAKDGQILNVVSVMHQVYDIEDYHDKKYLSLLLKDGSGFKSTVPTVPKWMWDQVDEIYNLEKEDQLCTQTNNAHMAAGLAIKNDPSKQTKDIIFRFPDGIKCHTEFYNLKNDRFKLKNYFRLLEKDCDVGLSSKVEVKIPFIVWKFVVVEENKRLLEPIAEDEEDIKQAVGRLGTMKISKVEE